MAHNLKYFFWFCILLSFSTLNCKNESRQDKPQGSDAANTKDSNQKKNGNNIQSKPSLTNLIVGTWVGVIEGDSIVWTVNSNGTEGYKWYHSNNIQQNQGTWVLDGDILHERWPNGSAICRIKFISEDHMLLTVLDNGNPNNANQERHYHRKTVDGETTDYENKPNKVENRVPHKVKEDHPVPPTYTTTCTTCRGKCVVPFEVGYDTSCLTVSEIQQAMSNSISAEPVRVWVRCCTCKGKGVVTIRY